MMAAGGCSCFSSICRKFCRKVASDEEIGSEPETWNERGKAGTGADNVVMGSSNMGDFVALPWHTVDKSDAAISEATWEDPKGKPKLTYRQNKHLSAWIRLAKKGKARNFFTSTPTSERIKQGFVADCSFLSCLASLANYESRYRSSLLTNIIKLVTIKGRGGLELCDDASKGKEPRFLEKGHLAIGVKMYFNGVPRCVLVDDWVPIRADGRLLCAHSADSSECWVTILEKAFVKLNGGTYSIKGTNPGIDIYHLTGWIPDIITLPSKTARKLEADGMDINDLDLVEQNDSKWDNIWDIMYAGFCSGSCVVCLGTGQISDAIELDGELTEGVSTSSGIVSDHAYSVLDIKDIHMPNKCRARLMYVKNPWGNISWTGRFSSQDSETWTPEMRRLLRYTPNKTLDTGTFWMEWNDVLRWFSHLYVSWKPSVFKNRVTLHHIWRPSHFFLQSNAPEDVYLSLYNPQFKIAVKFGRSNSATVWVMLLQHIKSTDKPINYLAMHVFSQLGPVICPGIPEVQGVYNNSECILVKLFVKRHALIDAPCKHMLTGDTVMAYENEKDASVLVIPSLYGKKITNDTPITLRAFSTRPIKVLPRPYVVKKDWHNCTINGSWDDTNSGGSPNELWKYFINPHYRLFFHEDTEAIILLECKEPISVNLRIFWGRLASFRALKNGNIINSGEYKIHCCSVHGIFQSGQYVVIPSAFRPSDRGEFRIVIHSNNPCIMKSLPYPNSKIGNIPNIHFQKMEVDKPVYITVEVPTLVSISILVPYGIMSDMYALFASSYHAPHKIPKEMLCHYVSDDSFFCPGLSCMFCGGPACRFRPLNYNDPKPDTGEEYDLILYSDLNGGLSKTGRIPSASARALFQKKRTINFTLVELLPSKKPYKLCAVGVATRGTFGFSSTNPITLS